MKGTFIFRGFVFLAFNAALCQGDLTRDLDIVLYGAYGCVGHFSAQHFAKQPGLKWAIAGRNETKLKALAASLAATGAALSPRPII